MTSAAKPKPPLTAGESRAYPVLPLRDIVVFPHMIVPLFVGREKSIKALEEVMRSDTFILLATQKNASDDDPATDAISASARWPACCSSSSCRMAPSRCWSKAPLAPRSSNTPIARNITKPTRT